MSNQGQQVAQAVAVGHVLSKQQPKTPKRGSMYKKFPLLALSLVAYTVISLIGGGSGWVGTDVLSIEMISQDKWTVTGGDLFLMFSLVLLFFEILRSTETGTDSIVNHALSAGVFIICLLCFILAPNYSTSAFFLLLLMTLLDFMAGFIVTTLSARRDFGVSNGLGAG